MKKLISILGILAFTASVAFAQSNIATVDQTGGNQTSNVTQSGSLNTADVDQFTNNFGPQKSTVLQTGTGNDAEVTQSQTGGGDKVTNNAYIEQSGTTNEAFQSQNAPSSSSGQNVWGKQMGISNNLKQVIAGGHTESLKAIQDGVENIADQYAAGSHTHGEIYQAGDYNEAIQYLTGSNNGYMSAKILIDQLGDDNLASQTFSGSGSSHKNNGIIYQTGDENEALQVGTGRELNLQINQTGNLNEASQNAAGNNYGLGIGLLKIDQLGNSNEASQMAVGDGIWGKITQTGNLNIATMSQTGDFNVGEIAQTGNGNESSVSQTGNDNEADVLQFGKNMSAVNQTGTGNDAAVQQGTATKHVTNYGFTSWKYGAYIDQEGIDNIADIFVSEGSNGARIYQLGNENEAYQNIGNHQQKTTNWDRMGVHINQVGDDNFASQQTVKSFGTHGSGGVMIDQSGNENNATQYIIGGRQNVTETFQEGDRNNFAGFTNSTIAGILDQSWTYKPAGNYAQYQRGEYSTVSIDVLGSDNITAQYQEGTTWGGGYNSATMEITGDFNEAAQSQLGTHNDASMMITGDYNRAGIQQLGNGHEGTITQSGNSNFATILQAPLP